MNLSSAFARSAGKNPQKVALYWGEQEYTFATLWDQSEHVASYLQTRLNAKPGARVALWLKNCPEFIPALFGILHAGCVVVPVNNFLKPAEVNYILQDAGADIMITDSAMAEHLPALQASRPNLHIIQVEQFGPDVLNTAKVPAPVETEKDLAVIIYTSGTTGRPKGAMLSHGNLLHNVESCRLVLQTVEQDRMAVLLPMFHSFMLTVGVFLPLIVGASIVLIRSLHPPRNVLQEIIQRQASVLPAIPQFFRSMVSVPANIQLPLRMCISGAAPLPVQILKEFGEKFPFPLIEGYGLSEASPVVTKNPLNGVRKPGSIGLPIPHVEVTIQNDAGQVLPPGEVGELCVRGGNVMMGYWNQPAETANVMRGEWLLTGDIGYKDSDGYIYITDRKKDMLLVNGINVYPREVEEIIYQFPGVREASVIGIPDPRKGEQPLAFISANEGATVDEKALLQFVRSKLADYKVPKKVVCLPALPRNATGKVLKTTLREMAGTPDTPSQ
ncbi:long-chain-fatty-acid--CoA ligase [Pedosphaera parvula]|uniref:AMP-dependent synthetase and ligase n=1 Tax=Pedosphaera parvula (strain Ellin514) TaxID=320771 RepID=B9XPD0_PEDPL|nr:long-chain fatty acid--CoA ligase [Pedosphaera parvula]EEF58270.1 AMP-dependent synthetase and ligase [Pedosphaera parvula Ellin514]